MRFTFFPLPFSFSFLYDLAVILKKSVFLSSLIIVLYFVTFSI